MSQRALQPIYINTGTLEFLASLSLYLSLCVYLSLSFLARDGWTGRDGTGIEGTLRGPRGPKKRVLGFPNCSFQFYNI